MDVTPPIFSKESSRLVVSTEVPRGILSVHWLVDASVLQLVRNREACVKTNTDLSMWDCRESSYFDEIQISLELFSAF